MDICGFTSQASPLMVISTMIALAASAATIYAMIFFSERKSPKKEVKDDELQR